MKRYLNDKQEAAFDGFMLKWQSQLNLMSWRVERGAGRAKSAMASVSISCADRLATYRTGEWGDTPINRETLEATAVHEMCHVLLAELKHLLLLNADEGAQMGAEHTVVNVLEKLLLRKA